MSTVARCISGHSHANTGLNAITKITRMGMAVIDAADHLFDGKVSEVGDAVEDLLSDFDG